MSKIVKNRNVFNRIVYISKLEHYLQYVLLYIVHYRIQWISVYWNVTKIFERLWNTLYDIPTERIADKLQQNIGWTTNGYLPFIGRLYCRQISFYGSLSVLSGPETHNIIQLLHADRSSWYCYSCRTILWNLIRCLERIIL